jgi:hypothetical protein
MPDCTYCNNEATEKRSVYDADLGCNMEVNVCPECGSAIDEGII